jgi:histidyl-tRNA synthetase
MKTISKRDLLPPSGFLELSVEESVAFYEVTKIIEEEYILGGFTPLETSIVERPAVLYANSSGETLSQGYGLRLLNPAPDAVDDSKDLGLRYDHTVPLARFVAAHAHDISFPYRRFAIGPVFRGERPKDGRYRQFTQADIDIIGNETLHIYHDSEMVALVCRVFKRLNIGSFTVRIGHRKVLQGLLEVAGLADADVQNKALQEIDRIEKISHDEVLSNLKALGMEADKAEWLLSTLTSNDLAAVKMKSQQSVLLAEGVQELEAVINGVKAYGTSESNYMIDLSIARGLAYYTGTVFETRLNDHPSVGSIASGGRYSDLAGKFVDKKLPGVGISIGLTRLMKRLIQAGLYPAERKTIANVLIASAYDDENLRQSSLSIATMLREAGIPCEVYIEPARLGKQIQFAAKRGFKWVCITGDETLNNDAVTLKNLETGVESQVSISDLEHNIM